MNTTRPPNGKRGPNLLLLSCFLVLGLVIYGLAQPTICTAGEKAKLSTACNNARQLIITLKSYAEDHNGRYPDFAGKGGAEPQSSNDAFRELFKAGLMEDEKVFTASSSPYLGDNDLGTDPEYAEALKEGENHWSMVAGLTRDSSPRLALVFENGKPLNELWPPVWDCDAAGQAKEGRAWKSGKIVIGRHDGSVNAELLESTKGDQVGLEEPEGSVCFPSHHNGLRILDVLR